MATYTYQDFEKSTSTPDFVRAAISSHTTSKAYRIAKDADEYDAQRNITVNSYVKYLYDIGGGKTEDFTASNSRIASNFFNNLVTQRVDYSLGNGVSFVQADEDAAEGDTTKEQLGEGFDHVIHEAAYCSVKHGVSFVFWNLDQAVKFELTEFVPLYDEHDGSLRAGIRFWRLNREKPMSAVFYREEGYSEWREDNGTLRPVGADGEFAYAEELRPYKTEVAYVPADDEAVIVGEENYGTLPIVPMWTSRLKQSALIGMRAHIDAYDLIKSGFANDLADCAEVYWIVKNAGGMTEADMAEFRDRLKLTHIAKTDGYEGAEAVPYTQQIPYEARKELLAELRNGIYEDFGALDVHTIAAGSTNDHIDAGYQPMDNRAADFEYWVGECIKQILRIAGIDDSPMFTRNRISNQKEQVEILATEAQWLDSETILKKLPNVSPDEVSAILQRVDQEDMSRLGFGSEQ